MFTPEDRAYLHKLGKVLNVMARELHVDLEVGLANLDLELQEMKEFDDLTNDVEATEGTEASAVVALNKLADLITANTTNPAALTALSARLKNSASTLALAINADAPEQPPVTTPGPDLADIAAK